MIFKQVAQVLDGTKTQTRRPVKPGDVGSGYRWKDGRWLEITHVRSKAGRLKWVIGDGYMPRTYAVQLGRGKKAVGRIRITKIRRETLGDISLDDIFAEGIFGEPGYKGWYTYEGGEAHISPLTAYFTLWDSIYSKGAWERMLEDDMWVLDFERSEG